MKCQNKRCGNNYALALYPNGHCNRCWKDSAEGRVSLRMQKRKEMIEAKKEEEEEKMAEEEAKRLLEILGWIEKI